jgi:simple sugar transport system ATP-binding protein
MTFALELVGIAKAYGARVANHDVTLRVEAGSVHAVVGENGAGKSTLMKIAYGETRADAGRIVIRGRDVDRGKHEPRSAIAAGLGMVHQHFMLAQSLSVAENVVLGREPRRLGLVDLAKARGEIRDLAKKVGLAIDPDRRVAELSVGEEQRVEIVKVLWRGAEVLLLDEPTAVLTPPEVRELFTVFRALCAEGKTIVLITHKLDEVMALADRTTVLRGGRVVGEFERGVAAEVIARAMVGGEPGAAVPAVAKTRGEVVLSVRGLCVGRGDGTPVRGVDLELCQGEILGIAGVEGNGQTELVEALAGLRRAAEGEVRLGGVEVTRAPPALRAKLGLAHVPEDRHARGLVLPFSVADNLILGRQREFSGPLGISRPKRNAHALALIARFDIRPPEPSLMAQALSGGNQQKVVVGRELSRGGVRLLLLAQPTRGVDLGAAALIHRQLVEAQTQGVAALLVSSDLAELRALSDRIAVMYRGRLVATLPVAQATDEVLAELMTGARTQAGKAATV